MAAPTFVAEVESAFNSNTTPKTSPTITGVAGDIIVVLGLSSGHSTTLSTPTNTGTAQTWTLRQSIVVTDYAPLYIWTATLSVTQNFTVSVARATGTDWYGMHVHQWRDSDGVGLSGKTNVASGAPSLTTGSLSADSALVIGNVDWNAADGTSRTWRNVNGSAATESAYFRDSSWYTLYVARALAGAAGTETVGLSAPSGQKYSLGYVEILGTAGGGPVTVNLGLASETDTAAPLTRSKAGSLGFTTEADTAAAVTAAKTEAIGQASQTDTALAVTVAKTEALGQSTEADVALGLAASKQAGVGTATEADTGLALIRSKTITLGLPLEVDTGHALSVSTAGGTTLGQAVEGDTAPALTRAKVIALGLPVESSMAPTLVTVKARTLGLSIETYATGAVIRLKSRPLALPLELDTADALEILGDPVDVVVDSIVEHAREVTLVDHRRTVTTTGHAREVELDGHLRTVTTTEHQRTVTLEERPQ